MTRRMLTTLTLMAAGCFLLLSGCEKTKPDEPEDFKLSELSGQWQGSAVFVRSGNCQISGEDSLLIEDTRMNWIVSDSGDVTITEDFFYSRWTGTVYGQLGIELIKVNDWTQSADTSRCVPYDTTEYVGQIVQTGSGFSVTLSSEENWCPADTCTFETEYRMEKM